MDKRTNSATESSGGGGTNDIWSSIKAKEHRAREQLIAIETLRIMQEKIDECYKREGVNHYKKCEKLTRKYYEMVKNRS